MISMPAQGTEVPQCPYATQSMKYYKKSRPPLYSSPLLLRRRRSGFDQTLVDPRNHRANEFRNTILIALGVVSVRLHPSFYAGFNLHRRACHDEMCESMPGHLFRTISSPRAIITVRLEGCLLDNLHHRFEVVRAMSDQFVIRGRDGAEVVGELGDPREMNRREDVARCGIHKIGKPESSSDGVYSKGLGWAGPCEHTA